MRPVVSASWSLRMRPALLRCTLTHQYNQSSWLQQYIYFYKHKNLSLHNYVIHKRIVYRYAYCIMHIKFHKIYKISQMTCTEYCIITFGILSAGYILLHKGIKLHF